MIYCVLYTLQTTEDYIISYYNIIILYIRKNVNEMCGRVYHIIMHRIVL